MRIFSLFLFILSTAFVSLSFANECPRPRYKTNKEAESAVRSCLARLAHANDDDDDNSDELDAAIYREVKSAAQSSSLECEESEQKLVEGFVAACSSGSRFKKVPNKDRYRCRVISGIYVYIFSSGESFNRVAVIGTEDGKPDVKANCEK